MVMKYDIVSKVIVLLVHYMQYNIVSKVIVLILQYTYVRAWNQMC